MLVLEPTPVFYHETGAGAEQKPQGLRALLDYLRKYPRLMWQLSLGMLEGRVVRVEPSLTVHTYRITVSLINGLTSTYHQTFKFRSEMSGTAQLVTADLRLIEHAFYGLRKLLM